MATVRFSLTCRSTRPGQRVAVAGSWSSWKPVGRFSGRSFPLWSGVVDIPEEACGNSAPPLDYKFVVICDDFVELWEDTIDGKNRQLPSLAVGSEIEVKDATFGRDRPLTPPVSRGLSSSQGSVDRDAFLNAVELCGPEDLDDFEVALVAMNCAQRSWRLRLSFIRSVLSDKTAASRAGFRADSLDCLVTVSAYLSFLASGQIRCEEDNGHHRPNHLASEARQIEDALDALHEGQDVDGSGQWSWAPFVARSIFPHLPSHATQFTVSVPMTRIRDIAHRGDIPHSLKQEIKHTLQNKLHRCAGPEDMETCERILDRVSGGGYSEEFVNQLRIFHGELREFFNASSLDERLQYLQSDEVQPSGQGAAAREASVGVRSKAQVLLQLKHGVKPALEQLEILTGLRVDIASLLFLCRSSTESILEPHVVQKVRLTDIELDSYAFALFAGIAKEAEEGGLVDPASWNRAISGLAIAMRNMGLSDILTPETSATANELERLSMGTSSENLLRIKAAVDRARRATEDFSGAVSDAYMRRVSSLSIELHVDRRAAAVFAEAVIRTAVAFQASRLADVLIRRIRDELKVPPWDPLFVGMAMGKVVFIESLRHAGEMCRNADAYIVICRTADGDEDIPANVRGVVLGHAIPHLSHLGVRARQAGVVFVSAENTSVFANIWSDTSRSMGMATLVVNSSRGLESLEKIQGLNGIAEITKKDSAYTYEPSRVEIGLVDLGTKHILQLAEAEMTNSSAKCTFAGRLATIASKSGGLFLAPQGVVVPFGVFDESLHPHRSQYEKLVGDYEAAFCSTAGEMAAEKVAGSLRDLIRSKFIFRQSHRSDIAKAFQDADGRTVVKVMVRSSANCEDLEDLSGAGLYDSIPNVEPSDDSQVAEAVLSVWASLWTRRASSSRAAYGVPHMSASMAVLVQRMVEPVDISFVAFSRNPVDTKDCGNIYVELAVGMGETLASGGIAGQPYRIRIDREDPTKVLVDSFASYGSELIPVGSGDMGVRHRTVDYSCQLMTIDREFRHAVATRIARGLLYLEDELGGGPLDIEGAISFRGSSADVDLYIVQARPQIIN